MDDGQFKRKQLDLLIHIKKNVGTMNSMNTAVSTCQCFLENQRKQLDFLEEKLKIHMMERGKLMYGLMAKEQVSLSYLKQIFTMFAKPLDEFIQLMTKWGKICVVSVSTIEPYKLQALSIARDMLKICLVLETQPDNTNYERNKNPVPNLLFLGAQCFSDLSIEDCQVTGVNESELLKASKDNKPLQNVKGYKGFTVKEESAQKQTKTSKAASPNQGAIVKSLGAWSIPKDQLTAAEKGNAHKEWMRLKFTMKINYHGVIQELWLLSLPFNIRKGSVQMYTFIGAFLWYYYTTANPYKDFSFPLKLSTAEFHDMIITRLETIGRKLSPVAKKFFEDRIEALAINGNVKLETVTRGPPSTRIEGEDQVRRTEDEAVNLFGFFTWFYALAKSLDTSGYLNKLWLDGYIYDICDCGYIEDKIKDPLFGHQMAVIRPSVTNIFKYQGKDIHVRLIISFKLSTHPNKVPTIPAEMEDITDCGLDEVMKKLPIQLMCLSDNSYRSIAHDNGQDKQYRTTKYRSTRGPELSGSDAISKHCATCRCHNAEVNLLPDGESQHKKVRNFSGNSDNSTTSDYDSVLLYKRGSVRSISTSEGSQIASPEGMTPSSQWNNLDFNSLNEAPGSPESGVESQMSPHENRIPCFDLISSPDPAPPCKEDLLRKQPFASSATTNRDFLMARFQSAYNTVSTQCSDEVIKHLTEQMMMMANSSSSQLLSSPPPPATMSLTGSMFVQRPEHTITAHSHSGGSLITDLNSVQSQMPFVLSADIDDKANGITKLRISNGVDQSISSFEPQQNWSVFTATEHEINGMMESDNLTTTTTTYTLPITNADSNYNLDMNHSQVTDGNFPPMMSDQDQDLDIFNFCMPTVSEEILQSFFPQP